MALFMLHARVCRSSGGRVSIISRFWKEEVVDSMSRGRSGGSVKERDTLSVCGRKTTNGRLGWCLELVQGIASESIVPLPV